jgi:serine/threonine protein kinase
MLAGAAKSDMPAVANYDLLERIAEGGMGTVYKGRHRPTGNMVAVKIVPPHLAANPAYLKRFEKEYAAARTLDHPNIVKALEFGHNGESPYLVMEFVEGESLGQLLERSGRIAETEAIKIIAQVAQGLHKAHKLGLVHRDVKPDNILLTPDGNVKLVDLGLVKEVEADLNLTRTGRGLGTPHYMAPEQFRNAKKADVRCDIYSLAATLYHMVTGEVPFKACGPLDAWMKKIHNELAAPREVVGELSERTDWAVRRAMSPDPNQRPASCREFVEDLTGQGTRKLASAGSTPIESAELWYLIYKDEDEVVHTVKGSKSGIRRSLKENLLGDTDNVRVSRTKTGPFDPLREHPEFRDLVLDLEASALAKTPTSQPLPTILPEPNQVASPPKPLPAVLPPPPAPLPEPAFGQPSAPHVHLSVESVGDDWNKWVLLILAALSTGAIGYFLVPMLARWR